MSSKVVSTVEDAAFEVPLTAIPRDATKKFIHDVLFANLPLPLQKLRTYLWLVLFSRALGTSGFGIWALFQTTITVGVMLTSMSQGNAMMRFLGCNRTQEEYNRAFSSVLTLVSISSLFIALALAAFSQQLSDLLFRDARGRTVILLAALSLPFSTYFEQMRGLLRARRLNRSWAFFTLSHDIPEMVILITVVYWFRNPVAVMRCYVLCGVVAACLGFSYLARQYDMRLVRPSRIVISQYVPYGLALVPGAVASMLSYSADRYLVSYYLDLRQVGVYSVCFTVSALGFFLVGSLSDVLLPEMAALYDGCDWNQFYSRFSGVQKFALGVSGAATALLVAFPREVLGIFTTREFAAGASTLAVLGLQGVFMSVALLYMLMLIVRLRVWWATGVWAGMGVLVLLLDVVLVPRIGILGAGFSQLLSSVAGAALAISLNWNIFRCSFRPTWVFQIGASVLVTLALARMWPSSGLSPATSVERLGAGIILFAAGLILTGYIRADEVRILKNAVWELGRLQKTV